MTAICVPQPPEGDSAPPNGPSENVLLIVINEWACR